MIVAEVPIQKITSFAQFQRFRGQDVKADVMEAFKAGMAEETPEVTPEVTPEPTPEVTPEVAPEHNLG